MNIKEYGFIDERVYSETLPNGLNIFAVPKRGFHKSFAYFAANYGGADRRYRLDGKWTDTPEGVAHFLEHRMFDTEDGDAMTKLSINGASPNAFTSTDMTAYYFDCIDDFPKNLETLLDFVSKPYFTTEGVEKERGIIEQEILMCDDDPDHCLYYGLLKSLFTRNPIRDSVAGTVESISQITAGTLYECHSAFYAPSNMVLCVAGNITPEQVSDIARRVLPDGLRGIPECDYGPGEPFEPAASHFDKAMDVSLPMFLAGCKVKPAKHGPDTMKLDIISGLSLDILAGHSSPLYFKLYGDGLVSGDFSASFDYSADTAYVFFGGETREPERVFGEVINAARKLTQTGPDPMLFTRLKKAAVGSYIRMLNSFDAICSSIAGSFFRGYDALTAPQLLMSVTEDDITSFIRENFIPENMAISIINPR